jgi:ribosomal RNA-processing protein 9
MLPCRAQGTAVECCKYITGTEWISGGNDGSVALWAQTKKRPVQVVRNAHGSSEAAGEAAAASAPAGEAGAPGAGSAGRWVQSVAVCRGTDLMASGAGDGSIKLWCLDDSAKAAGGNAKLKLLGSLPAKGFVNGVQIARSGKFVVAAVGQEPRLGRWQREGKARNGLLVHRLDVSEVQ